MVYHLVGTTERGDLKYNEIAVVDGEMRLGGLKAVRIVDADVFLGKRISNTTLTVLAIGERSSPR